MNIKNVTTAEELDALGSALSFEGLIPDEENLTAAIKWMNDHGADFKPNANVYVTKGHVMNQVDGLSGPNAYPDNVNVVSFRLEDIGDWQRLILARMNVGGRWLDDIRDNNRRREAERD